MAFSKKEAKQFQADIRRGLDQTAHKAYQARLADINAETKKQREECGQELAQTLERLDQAVTAEREAVAKARRDKQHAAEAEAAARNRLRIAGETRAAKGVQKKRSCKVEADAIRARRAAEQAHRKDIRAIDRILKPRKKPLAATSREKRSDEVANNIPDELVPLWRKVRQSFRIGKRGEGRLSLTEAFEHYAAENPDEVAAAQEEEGARKLADELEKREREELEARKERGPRKAGPRRESSRRASGAEHVPF